MKHLELDAVSMVELDQDKDLLVSHNLSSTYSASDEKHTDQLHSLGTARLRTQDGAGDHVLVPTPSSDPNDPLYWSQRFKYYVLTLLCFAILLVTLVAAGPSIAIVNFAVDFTGQPPNIPKAAYFLSVTALMQGVSTIALVPLMNKFGRRPFYIGSLLLFTFSCLWAAISDIYGSHMGARICIGIAGGALEILAPLSIADIFFVHERGLAMSLFSSFLGIGVSIGMIADGGIALNLNWRYIYWIDMGLVGLCAILVIFTLPETAFRRDPASLASPRPKRSFFAQLAPFDGIFTSESILRMAVRPVGLIMLPAVLWSSCVFGSQLGFIVAMSSNIAVPYAQPPFSLNSLQIGLLFGGGIVGAVLGIFGGGWLNDWIVGKLAARNNGIYEPEFRLPALLPSIVLTPIGLMLYAVGVKNEMHWITAAISLGLTNFTIVCATNVTLTYCIDILKPISGEVIMCVICFKSCIGFAIAVETNPWIESAGYITVFSILSAIGVVCLLPVFGFYYWGKKIRIASMEWRLTQWVGWERDREDFVGKEVTLENFRRSFGHS